MKSKPHAGCVHRENRRRCHREAPRAMLSLHACEGIAHRQFRWSRYSSSECGTARRPPAVSA
jgi:hypothetical protein